MPYAIVRDPEIRQKIEHPHKYSTTERPYGFGKHAAHDPEYPNLSVTRMLDIERSLRDRERDE
jgi:hypothetical protein